MKTLHKTLLISALLVTPFVNVQARDDAAHRAWIEAQKIDIQPKLEITETEIPADQATGSTGSQMPGAVSPTDTMPSQQMPSSNMPPSGGYEPATPSGGYEPATPSGGYEPATPSGGYEPATPSGGTMPQGSAPIESPLDRNPGTGFRSQ